MVPIIEKLLARSTPLRPNEVGALIISPTRFVGSCFIIYPVLIPHVLSRRELAAQIHSVFELFLGTSQHSNDDDSENEDSETDIAERPAIPPPLLLVSGTKSSPQEDLKRFLAKGAPIVIGTPGRIEEFLLKTGRSAVSVKELEMLVLDEADR